MIPLDRKNIEIIEITDIFYLTFKWYAKICIEYKV